MGLKKSQGNMYDWVTHMHSHLAGECPHKCSYCYVQRNRFGVAPRWKGGIRFVEDELDVNYGRDKIIFIEHMSDMFADGIHNNWITQILEHCRKYPDNVYVFQTKNPGRAQLFRGLFPLRFIIGTTIESNRVYKEITKAPPPKARYMGLQNWNVEKFITIEPILDFDVDVLVGWMRLIKPSFVNIGADSKGCKLPEPSKEKIERFIARLRENKIVIKKKSNLERLL